jgi:hypothetical protein
MMPATIVPTFESLAAFPIQGFKICTTNAAKGQPATSKIGPLWGQFFVTMGAGKIKVGLLGAVCWINPPECLACITTTHIQKST